MRFEFYEADVNYSRKPTLCESINVENLARGFSDNIVKSTLQSSYAFFTREERDNFVKRAQGLEYIESIETRDLKR